MYKKNSPVAKPQMKSLGNLLSDVVEVVMIQRQSGVNEENLRGTKDRRCLLLNQPHYTGS